MIECGVTQPNPELSRTQASSVPQATATISSREGSFHPFLPSNERIPQVLDSAAALDSAELQGLTQDLDKLITPGPAQTCPAPSLPHLLPDFSSPTPTSPNPGTPTFHLSPHLHSVMLHLCVCSPLKSGNEAA